MENSISDRISLVTSSLYLFIGSQFPDLKVEDGQKYILNRVSNDWISFRVTSDHSLEEVEHIMEKFDYENYVDERQFVDKFISVHARTFVYIHCSIRKRRHKRKKKDVIIIVALYCVIVYIILFMWNRLGL